MRLGMIGTGRIARRFVKEVGCVDGITVTAVYNPHAGSADCFVSEAWADTAPNKPKVFHDIKLFWDCTDAVYIASVHETHYEYIMDALQHGKHILCEKPLCLSRDEAEKAYAFASERGLVLFEAVKTAYCPGFVQLLNTAVSGVIGEVRNVEACFTKLEKEDSRELTDRQYGGSFTELGSYVLLPALKLFGTEYRDIRFDSIRDVNGIDLFTRTTMTYPQGMATLTCGLGVKSEGRLIISGTKGYLIAEAPWWKTNHFEAHFEDASQVKEYTNEFLGDGLRYEIVDFYNAVNAEKNRQIRLSPDESIAMASVMGLFLTQRSVKQDY